jgi:CheY-like chemotaxis protein
MEHKPVKILITDDDQEDLELIEEAILKAEPTAELQKFTNGRIALEFLNSRVEKDLPCLIILDYSMPYINGSEMLSYIKENVRYNRIPKIVLSTSNSPLHIHECISNGATEYLVKPNNMKALQALATKLLTFCNSPQS